MSNDEWIIGLARKGGDEAGGGVATIGTPEEVVKEPRSDTGY
jgi:excinuclease UvrABC ATPase subunit